MSETGGKGGDVRFVPGKGGRGVPARSPGPDGNIIFLDADGSEFLRLGPKGLATVRGEVIVDNRQVYERLADWLDAARCCSRPSEGGEPATLDGEPLPVVAEPEEFIQNMPDFDKYVRCDAMRLPAVERCTRQQGHDGSHISPTDVRWWG